jgi:hypothetical protein
MLALPPFVFVRVGHLGHRGTNQRTPANVYCGWQIGGGASDAAKEERQEGVPVLLGD